MKKASVILACLLFPLCTPLFPQTSQDPTPSDPETNGQIPGDWILTASGESAYTFTFTYREGMDNGFNNVRYMMVEGDNEISLTLSPSGGSDPAWLNIRKEGESPVQSFMASDTETTSDTFLLPAGYYRLELISTSDMPSPSTTDPLSASTGPDWSVALPPDCEVTVTLNARGLKPPLDGGLNYIVRISSRAPASSLHYGGENTVTSIEYFDGLGRGVETVELGASGTGENDLVYLTEYDPYGRVSKEWLPGTCPVSGAFVTPTVVKSSAISTHGDTHPYSLQTYEASPLDRPSIQTGAGAAWHAAGKGVRQSRLANVENVDTLDCALLTVTQTGDTALAITKVGNYPSGELYALRVEDEDGNVSLTFTDKSDRTILTRQVRREGTSKELLDTYYIYDVYGNLRAVLPPLAADVMAAASAGTSFGGATTPALREYAYLYIYDGYNRPVRHKLPGCGWVYTVYDRVDRVIATQNAEQRAEGDWAFAIPDRLGRTVLTGTLRTLDGAPLAVGALDTVRVLAEFDGAGADYLGYSLRLDGVTATLGGHEILSANYYDGYAFRSLPGFSADALSYRTSGIGAEYLTRYGTDEEPASPFSSLTASSPHHGALTGTATAMLDSDGDMLYSCLYYDKYHRLVQSRSTNSVGGTEEEFIAYNFTDQPVKREHIHTKGTTPITEEYTYTYDHVGRPLTTTHQLNGGVVVTLADNSYDELGRLRTNKRTGNVKLGTTYSYNVRSWTKSIDGTLFTETLHYNDAPSGISPAYNGNISAMNWKAGDESKSRRYGFTYDGLSRLVAADYSEGSNPPWLYLPGDPGEIGIPGGELDIPVDSLSVPSSGEGASSTQDAADNPQTTIVGDTETGADYSATYAYNKQGSPTRILRHGRTGTSGFGIIDDLTLTYRGNRLISVEDAAAAPLLSLDLSGDFRNGATATAEYTYDANGNRVSDLNRNITEITRNMLNLPSQITANGKTKHFVYSAGGAKLRSVTDEMTIDYVGNKVYENDTLKHVFVDGGYIENGVYHFYLTDHLGNNRVVATATGTVVQTNHYYPYGMTFAEGIQTSRQPYKFGGKEKESWQDLGSSDFGARIYQPALAEFDSGDPMMEKYYSVSPYAYCMGNPIRFVDPTGMDWYEDGNGNVMWRRSSDREYTDDDGVKWSNIGVNYLLIDGATSILFTQYTKDNGELGLSTSTYNMDNKDEANDLTAAVGTLLSTTSTLASSIGEIMGVSGASFRLTNSRGIWDPHLYRNGWGGNQWVKTTKISEIGKGLRSMGNIANGIGVFYSAGQLLNATSIETQLEHGFDIVIGAVGFIPVAGTAISVYWNTVGKSLHELYVKNVILEQMKMDVNPGLPAFQAYK